MGHVYAEIEMDQDEVKRMDIRVMVDSGAWKLCINENIQSIIDLPFIKKERLRLADGQSVEYDLVGQVLIKFGGRDARCEAIVLPGEARPVLGVVPLESLNLVIHPLQEKLVISDEIPLLVGLTKL